MFDATGALLALGLIVALAVATWLASLWRRDVSIVDGMWPVFIASAGVLHAARSHELDTVGVVALARGMLYDPRWGWHAAAELGGEVSAPPQYWRSQPSTQKALFGATTFGTR